MDDLRHQIDSGYWPKLCSSCRSLTLGVIPKIEAAVPKRARVAASASENTLDCSEASDDKQTDREREQFPPAKESVEEIEAGTEEAPSTEEPPVPQPAAQQPEATSAAAQSAAQPAAATSTEAAQPDPPAQNANEPGPLTQKVAQVIVLF